MHCLSFAIALCLVSFTYSFLFPSSGCCGPPPPPPCPCLPPIQIPSLCLPPLPRLSLPCPPPSCGCGRKKRSAIAPVSGGATGNKNETLCNNPQIRKIILQNLYDDPVQTKTAIHSEVKAKLGGQYVVMCAQGTVSFVADSSNYCIDGSKKQTCYVFEA